MMVSHLGGRGDRLRVRARRDLPGPSRARPAGPRQPLREPGGTGQAEGHGHRQHARQRSIATARARPARPQIGALTRESIKTALLDDFATPWSVCRPPRPSLNGTITATVATIVMEPALGVMEVAPLPALGASFTTYRLEAARATATVSSRPLRPLARPPSPAADRDDRLPNRWLLLTLLTSGYGAGAFGMLGISPLSPSLVEGFGLSRLQVAFLVPSVYLGGLFFALPGGRLADRLGVRPSLLGGLALGRRRPVRRRVLAVLPRLPALPVRGRHRLERGQSRARQGHHGRLPALTSAASPWASSRWG